MRLHFGVVVVSEHPAGENMMARMGEAVEQARVRCGPATNCLIDPYAHVQSVLLCV